MKKIRLVSAGIAVTLLVIEVLIALFVHDSFVRPYLGDVLAVIFVYFLGRVFFPEKPAFLPKADPCCITVIYGIIPISTRPSGPVGCTTGTGRCGRAQKGFVNLQLEGKSLRSDFVKFVSATAASLMVFSLYSMVDGLLVSLGVNEYAMSAVNLAIPFTNALFSIAVMFAVGTSTIIAIFLAQEKRREAGITRRYVNEDADRCAEEVWKELCRRLDLNR